MATKFAKDYAAAAAAKAAADAKARVAEIKDAADTRRAELVNRAAKLGNTGFVGRPLPPSPYQPPTPSTKGGRKTRRRLMSRKYCKKTPCRRMGFTQRASCRPYKNCYRK